MLYFLVVLQLFHKDYIILYKQISVRKDTDNCLVHSIAYALRKLGYESGRQAAVCRKHKDAIINGFSQRATFMPKELGINTIWYSHWIDLLGLSEQFSKKIGEAEQYVKNQGHLQYALIVVVSSYTNAERKPHAISIVNEREGRILYDRKEHKISEVPLNQWFHDHTKKQGLWKIEVEIVFPPKKY